MHLLSVKSPTALLDMHHFTCGIILSTLNLSGSLWTGFTDLVLGLDLLASDVCLF